MISLSWPSFCVLRTFLRLFDVKNIYRGISLLYFLLSSLALFLMVLHIFSYSILCLSSPFSNISRHFVIRARVGDDTLDFSGLATLGAICRIMSVTVSLVVAMSSSSYSVSNRFLKSSWNSIFHDPICVAPTHWPLGHQMFPLHL